MTSPPGPPNRQSRSQPPFPLAKLAVFKSVHTKVLTMRPFLPPRRPKESDPERIAFLEKRLGQSPDPHHRTAASPRAD